jgi:hypothetical protein
MTAPCLAGAIALLSACSAAAADITPLAALARAGNAAGIGSLVAAGADVNASDPRLEPLDAAPPRHPQGTTRFGGGADSRRR